MAIMVSHFPLRLDTFDRTAEEVANSVTSGPDTSITGGASSGGSGGGGAGAGAGDAQERKLSAAKA